MSYILDALTKAAKQRERQVPVVQRLLSPPAPPSPWVRVPGSTRAALAAGGVLLAVLVIWWLRPVPSLAPPDQSAVVSSATPTPIPTPRSAAVEPARPSGRLEPMPRADVQVGTPSPRGRQGIADAPIPIARPATSPAPGFRATSPQAAAPVEPPTPAARPALPTERSDLKLEALIYSDLPGQRMVFINGRRYAEGDVVDGRLRVEEIHEEGVELSDQGRRFTLRATR